jgi:hypothetical protein
MRSDLHIQALLEKVDKWALWLGYHRRVRPRIDWQY